MNHVKKIKKGFLAKGGPQFRCFCGTGQDMPQDRRPSCLRSELPGLTGSLA